MAPPRFDGPTFPCPRCGSVVGVFTALRVEHLKPLGWDAFRAVSYVNWCGHAQELIPFPRPDGTVRFVPVLGEAT